MNEIEIPFTLPPRGEVPMRPATLKRPPEAISETEATIADAVTDLLIRGMCVAYGGLSILGADGNFVPILGFLRARDGELKGWTLAIGHPERKEPVFVRIDTTTAPLTEIPFPNVMMYFAGEADEKLIAADATPDDLEAAARFVLPFISDSGPPESIDW